MALLAGQRSRGDRGFERLYRRHIEDVYRYALAVLGNRADAEDVTQTAFLNAYRAFESGQRPEKPLNWLIAITHNVCRQRFRDAARQPREVVLERELAAESDEQERRGGFGQEDIRRALSQLSFSQRSALALRELEGRSYKEIAAVLELTESAVETLIFRARRAFREQLEGTLSCSEAERAISRQLDGMLVRGETGGLRAHLRACTECASLARRLRAQRAALRGIAIVPLPQSLATFTAAGGSVAGGAALGAGLGIKVAALGAAALVAAGVSTEVVTRSPASAGPTTTEAASRSERPAVSRDAAGVVAANQAAAAASVERVSVSARRRAPVAVARPKAPVPRRKPHQRPTKAVTPTPTTNPSTLVRAAPQERNLLLGARPLAGSRGVGSGHGGTAAGKGPTSRSASAGPANQPSKAHGSLVASEPAKENKAKKPSTPGVERALPTKPAELLPAAAAAPALAEGGPPATSPADPVGGPPADPPGQSGNVPGAAAVKSKDKEKQDR
jgi:RNA polymerase sigma factor (sigma-70 family)